MARTFVLTNDFPPRRGGIESFVKALADRIDDPDHVVVFTAEMPGWRETDRALAYRVLRSRSVAGSMGPLANNLVPTPLLRRAVLAAFAETGCDRVLIGSSVPLGLLAADLRAAGAKRVVALTHGHEVWWSKLPLARLALREVGDQVDVLTYITDWTRDAIGVGLSPAGRAKQRRLAPGVDTSVFYPGVGGGAARRELGLAADVPVVVSIARLVTRKGQDKLIAAWPLVRDEVPDARLVIVGDGPHRTELELAAKGTTAGVTFIGSVPWNEVPAWMDAANVFAMPSRSRLGGLEPEGLGIVFLEAAACGKPVLVGRSGGAPEATQDGVSGYVVEPTDVSEIARRLVELLQDPQLAAQMGARGRAWVEAHWQWDDVAAAAREYLDL